MDRKSQYSSGTVQSKQNINQSKNNSEQTVWLDPDIPNFSKWMLERRPPPPLGYQSFPIAFSRERKETGAHMSSFERMIHFTEHGSPILFSGLDKNRSV